MTLRNVHRGVKKKEDALYTKKQPTKQYLGFSNSIINLRIYTPSLFSHYGFCGIIRLLLRCFRVLHKRSQMP